MRWVYTEKMEKGEKVKKATLVARGFEEEEIESFKKDSPTCNKESLRVAIAIIASNNY